MLPPEIIGKILSKTRLQYNTRLFKECGFEKEITGYAETMLRGEEALWDGTVQWIKSILESLKTTIRRVDGHPNRWAFFDGAGSFNVPDKFLAVWPRYWYYEEGLTDDDDEPLTTLRFVLNEDVCKQIAGDNEYCLRATNDTSVELVLFRDEDIHPVLKGLEVKVIEAYTVYNEEFHRPVDTYTRILEIRLAFSDGDVYSVSFTMQEHFYPDRLEFQLCREKDGRSYTERRQTEAKERHRNQDHLLTFVKRLLTIEPAPYTRLHVSKYSHSDFDKVFKEHGFYKYGLSMF